MQKFRTLALALSIATLGVAPATASATQPEKCKGQDKKECKQERREARQELRQENKSQQKANSSVRSENTNAVTVGGKNADVSQVIVGSVDSDAQNKNRTDQKADQKGGGKGGDQSIKQGNTNIQIAVSNVISVNTNVAVVNGKNASVSQAIVSDVSSSALEQQLHQPGRAPEAVTAHVRWSRPVAVPDGPLGPSGGGTRAAFEQEE